MDVWEDITSADAPIVFSGPTLSFVLTKRSASQTNTSASWGGKPLDAITAADGDLLGKTVLDAVQEPDYATVAALAPPALLPRRSCGDFQLGDGQTFVGSRVASEKHAFSATGEMSYSSVNQAYHLANHALLLNRTRSGLLGDWLLAPFWRWTLPNGDSAEQLAFAPGEGTSERPLDTSAPQPVWLRFLNISASGELRYVHYVDTYETYPAYCSVAPDGGFPTQLECDAAGAEGFYTALLAFARYWNSTLGSEEPMEVEVPREGDSHETFTVDAFAKHSIARLMVTRRDHFFPRYGAPPDAYGAPMIDGFQDVFVADLATYLEHGFLSTARGVFDNYFTFYVRSHARVNYRGPEVSMGRNVDARACACAHARFNPPGRPVWVMHLTLINHHHWSLNARPFTVSRCAQLAQYGRILTLAAQYYRVTADDELLLKHASKLLSFSSMLLHRRRAAQLLPRSDPSYGMIRGVDESDELFTAWSREGSELPHFSFSLEAWRGFHEIGPIWQHLGSIHARVDLMAAGETLVNETAPLLADVRRAIDKSAVPVGSGLFCHPYVAGEGACADMNRDGPAPHARVSGTKYPYNPRASEPWRSYSGMLYSGGLNSSTVNMIVQHNLNRSKLSRIGVWSGGPGFDNRLMGFTAQGHGYGLLQHDLIAPLLLLLYSLMAHVCSRGTWTCFESRGLPDFPPAGGYATPSQAVVPLLLKWMLVFETPPALSDDERSDPNAVHLVLCRGIPRAWLRDGQRVVVRNAPTSLGVRLNLTLHSTIGGTVPSVSVSVSTSAMGKTLDNAKVLRIALRLRMPGSWQMSAVVMDGAAWPEFDAATETVMLPPIRRDAVKPKLRPPGWLSMHSLNVMFQQ